MIEGIDILNKTAIMEYADWAIRVICSCIAIAVIFIFVGVAIKSIGTLLLSLVFMVLTLIMLLIGGLNMMETGLYTYEVIIDESVDFLDVYEKYNVIERRGDIWVIEDKEK